MAIYTYEDVTPSLIDNTTMQKMFIDGVHKVYVIGAIDGYVLHDKSYDFGALDPEFGGPLFDEEGNEVMLPGYTSGTVTCAANYNFVTNPREFYAVPEDSVPADQIFGGTGGNHEIM